MVETRSGRIKPIFILIRLKAVHVDDKKSNEMEQFVFACNSDFINRKENGL